MNIWWDPAPRGRQEGESELIARLEDEAQAWADECDHWAELGETGSERFFKAHGRWAGLRKAITIVSRYETELEEKPVTPAEELTSCPLCSNPDPGHLAWHWTHRTVERGCFS